MTFKFYVTDADVHRAWLKLSVELANAVARGYSHYVLPPTVVVKRKRAAIYVVLSTEGTAKQQRIDWMNAKLDGMEGVARVPRSARLGLIAHYFKGVSNER